MKKLFIVILLWGYQLHSQYNDLLKTNDSLAGSKGFFVQIDNLAFVKNNEYFNLIADGYTLIGNRLNTELSLQTHPDYIFTAGMMWLQYDGLSYLSKNIPYFSLHLKQKQNDFYIGKLYTDDNHLLPQVLYAFERHLDTRSVENGLQHRYNGRHWQTDTWLQWEQFIFKKDTMRERLNFGHVSHFTFKINRWRLQIPVQIYLHHRGGQINVRQNNNHVNSALVVANGGGSFDLSYKLSSQSFWGIATQYYWHRINSDLTETFHYKQGSAINIKVYYRNKIIYSELNYWKSNSFVSSKGDDMFQSVSRRVEKYLDEQGNSIPVFGLHTEPARNLIYGRFAYQKEIFKDLFLAFTTEVFYQLNKATIYTPVYKSEVFNHLDYNTGLYVRYIFKHKLTDL